MTPRQKDCYDFIKAYIEENVISPTYAEIATGVGAKSKSDVSRLLIHLEEQGLISRIPHRTRSIKILPTDDVYAENARLRVGIADIRVKLHAANRPVLREGLRLELRDICDALLSPERTKTDD